MDKFNIIDPLDCFVELLEELVGSEISIRGIINVELEPDLLYFPGHRPRLIFLHSRLDYKMESIF